MTIKNFNENYKGQYSIAFYFYVDSDNNTVLLLYSWILPNQNGKEGWFKREIEKNVLALFGSFDADRIKKLWDGLLKNESLDVSTNNAIIPLKIQIAENIKTWTLPSENYIYRPKCTYAVKDEWGNKQKLFYSTSKNIIADIESLFCLKKEKLFLDDQVFKKNCNILKKEIGIDFFQTQAGRLGNVEWYTFPSGNIQDKSYVRTESIKDTENNILSCRKIKVTLTSDVQGDFLVNIRCINGKAIICDIVKEISISNTEKSIDFDASEEISSQKIVIWRKKGDLWVLWYEKEFSPIRSLHMRMNISAGTGIVESRNLNQIKKQSNLIKRVDGLQKVSLYSKASDSIIGEDQNDPWRQVIIEIDDKLEKYFPIKSESIFLPKGWNGQVHFYEWLKGLPSKVNDLDELFIIDPYIEEEALRFIPRFGNTDIHYTLIANTKIVQNSAERRTSIKNAANLIFSKPKLFKVTIYDVIKEKQIIHARYILLKNSNDLFVKGFHLSNSIQMANKNFPLLITEIPIDVISKIQDWLADILDSKLEVLWDSNQTLNDKQSKKIVSITKDYPDLTTDGIIKGLVKANKKEHFSIFKQIWMIVFSLLKKVRKNSQKKISSIWNDVCENAYNNNTTKDNLIIVAGKFSSEMWDDIFKEIEEYFDDSKELVISDESSAILQNLKTNDFSTTLDFADTLFDYLHPIYSISPSLHFLVELSARFHPEKLLKFSKELYERLNDDIENTAQIGLFFHKLFNSLSYLFMYYDGDEVIWLNSKIDLIIGFVASSLNKQILDGNLDVDVAIKKIECLEQNKILNILVKWIYELRILDNRRNNNGDLNKRIRDQIFGKIIEIWPNNANKEFIKDVLIRCGGPGNGNWACSTTNELFTPLIDDKKIPLDTFWDSIKELCEVHLDYETHYSNTDSLNVFEVFGFIAGKIDDNKYKDDFTQIVNSELRNISKPFAMSISYENYNNSLEKLQRLLIVFVCINKYLAEENQNIEKLKSNILKQLQGKKLLLTTPNAQLNETTELYLNEENKKRNT